MAQAIILTMLDEPVGGIRAMASSGRPVVAQPNESAPPCQRHGVASRRLLVPPVSIQDSSGFASLWAASLGRGSAAAGAHPPDSAIQVEFAGLGLGDHAVEVATRRGGDVSSGLRRHDGDSDRCLFASHGTARLTPEVLVDAQIVAQPVGGIDDVGPARD